MRTRSVISQAAAHAAAFQKHDGRLPDFGPGSRPFSQAGSLPVSRSTSSLTPTYGQGAQPLNRQTMNGSMSKKSTLSSQFTSTVQKSPPQYVAA